MALNVAVYFIEKHRRSGVVCEAMRQGIRACGDIPHHFPQSAYRRPDFDVAVFYGYTQILRRVMADYVRAGKPAVYVDLGYWGREGLTGYHKISVNARHPTAYFQTVSHLPTRARRSNIPIDPWRQSHKDDCILLAGMGEKAAEAEGFQPEQFERNAIMELRKHTNRPIIYRPKPSWLNAKPIEGTIFSPKHNALSHIFRRCHAVVTHHSNVAVEAIAAGVPAWCWKGVAMPMASSQLDTIENPLKPSGREQWINDIAYTQWNVAEMQAGIPWAHLKHEGLVK